jgi:hypothetical protein
VDDQDIAAALEDSIVLRPLTIARDDRGGLVGVMTGGEVATRDLSGLPDRDQRPR